jgi:hypothetical protein
MKNSNQKSFFRHAASRFFTAKPVTAIIIVAALCFILGALSGPTVMRTILLMKPSRQNKSAFPDGVANGAICTQTAANIAPAPANLRMRQAASRGDFAGRSIGFPKPAW